MNFGHKFNFICSNIGWNW